METTAKAHCREIANLLRAHGIDDAVLCPGSRNAPLILALSRAPGMHCLSVVDERSAAFIALGLASIKNKPVALVCTSGSAVLNFAPAVAEAYYRRVPLIVISADRPAEWIDQDDSQTLRQPGVLHNIVKESYNVPVETGDPTQAWLVNRTVNDALLMAEALPQGPVHINVQLEQPLGCLVDCAAAKPRKISVVRPEGILSTARARQLGTQVASPARLLIIAGFMAPCERATRALRKLAAKPNVAVLHEAQANVHGSDFIGNIDSVLSILNDSERQSLVPDVVITIGGSLVSRFIKSWLRSAVNSQRGLRHWHVGHQPYSVDCFMGLDMRVEMDAAQFLIQLASAVQPHNASSDYAQAWQQAAAEARRRDKSYETAAPWSDYKAMAMIMERVPRRWNLQLSNGTAVRYAQLFDYDHVHRIDCNRGVSGIDGCTSTALGAALAYSGITLLITGDMSAQYDMGALAANCMTSRLRIVVLNNAGGGIFRFIPSTAHLPEREQYFSAGVNLPLRELAQGFGFRYYEARSEKELAQVWPEFAKEGGAAAILNVVTDPEISSRVLNAYFTR